jgi:hypothetical protein
MGVLAHGSVYAWPSARPPIDTSGICWAHVSEGGRVSECYAFFYPKSYFFFDLKPHAKFLNPTITPSRRKVCGGEKKKKEKIKEFR